ncbi:MULTISPECIES: ABC transporter ATP-binding protein [Prochlorococcus]|uniref:ABC transporter ATP-binding protein n=1 Tax=Prochlorococcus TaxID=1218 RepID=UPI00068A8706|nr:MULTISPECIES: ABC transporter ATP-binding protein [Prochlorococcus]
MNSKQSDSEDSFLNSHCLNLEKISFSWEVDKKILNQISFAIPSPGLWMLVGRNGSGKSTLFRLISGLIEPEEGTLQCSYKPALMFQNPDHQLLLPSCESDLMLSTPENYSRAERKKVIDFALHQVGLQSFASRPIHTLSGGQKQRLALAGALVSNANLLLLDEPTALLDPRSQRSILKIVQRLSKRPENPIAALWITHRIEELEYCDGAAIMKNGKLGPWHKGLELMRKLK